MARWKRWLVVLVLAAAAGGLWWEQRQERQAEELDQARDALAMEEQLHAPRDVTYFITGDAQITDVTWTDGVGQIAQDLGRLADEGPVRLTAERGDVLSVVVQNAGALGDVGCRIVVDGEVVASNESSGGGAIATCEATAP